MCLTTFFLHNLGMPAPER